MRTHRATRFFSRHSAWPSRTCQRSGSTACVAIRRRRSRVVARYRVPAPTWIRSPVTPTGCTATRATEAWTFTTAIRSHRTRGMRGCFSTTHRRECSWYDTARAQIRSVRIDTRPSAIRSSATRGCAANVTTWTTPWCIDGHPPAWTPARRSRFRALLPNGASRTSRAGCLHARAKAVTCRPNLQRLRLHGFRTHRPAPQRDYESLSAPTNGGSRCCGRSLSGRKRRRVRCAANADADVPADRGARGDRRRSDRRGGWCDGAAHRSDHEPERSQVSDRIRRRETGLDSGHGRRHGGVGSVRKRRTRRGLAAARVSTHRRAFPRAAVRFPKITRRGTTSSSRTRAFRQKE